MMIKIDKITSVEENAFKGMSKYYIVDSEGREGYTFAQVQEGSEVDGFWQLDKRGQNQLKKNKLEGRSFPTSKEFKADPLKQASIERQTALVQAVLLYNQSINLGTEKPADQTTAKEVLEVAKVFHVWLVKNPDKESK